MMDFFFAALDRRAPLMRASFPRFPAISERRSRSSWQRHLTGEWRGR
jgi:hypothetical protein